MTQVVSIDTKALKAMSLEQLQTMAVLVAAAIKRKQAEKK